jgi:hypothetical protein
MLQCWSWQATKNQEILASEGSFVQSADCIENTIYGVAKDCVLNPEFFTMGHARREASHHLFGTRHIGPFFEAEIYDIYVAGNKDPLKKCQPGRIFEILETAHPFCLKIPSEHEVKDVEFPPG